QIRGLDQAARNSQDGISLIQTAEGALNETHSILQRMRELAVQASNDTNVTADRSAIQTEINQLASEVTRIAEKTTFNNQVLLSGGLGDLNIQTGANSGDITKITLSDMDAGSLTIDALDVSDNAKANAAITSVSAAISVVSTFRANLRAYQNRLEHTINNLNVNSENLTAAESRIRDVDMAKEMMIFSKNNILQQAAQAMLAQANQQPQGVLQLLR
ncbi:MAG TPA: flagellin, partial [Clostridium sp.]|nr:flagellin [Clostridium sp.]